ncbi:uncharacterized protein E0L32_007700 [Thyridium curvatum]|uniref:Crh-like protein n=1 Tax=Thyridium curvatum TaxID=1093900 RepID=A0A507B2H5_9PEZI|nr:uncharacterized protein E0L32_007700 [Thyridium curvatum]TPX11489.1 hypothetical protein E0L32_007700 [Thyridium curvatum]
MMSKTAVAALLGLFGTAFAQTYTNCNPTEKTCPPDKGLSSRTYSVDFTKGASSDWNATSCSDRIAYSSAGAAFTVKEHGDSPTIESKFYIFFGSISVIMKAAPGTGIVSSAVLESDDLDEVDWEWIGGSANEVQTNYFGKGNTTVYNRGKTIPLDSSTQATARNYTIDWTPKAITWYVDGSAVRTLAYADALGGQNYPQTPMTIRLGIWAGGDSSEPKGTIEWAGGVTDYGAGPFTMYVERVDITNYNPGSSYTYSGTSGDWTSIKIDGSASDSSSSSSSASVSATSTTSTQATKSSSMNNKDLSTPKVGVSTGSTSGTSGNSSSTDSSATSSTKGSSPSTTIHVTNAAPVSMSPINAGLWVIGVLLASMSYL